MSYKVQTFDSDGAIIAYTDQGDGDPILLLHGFASNITTNWIDTKWISYLLREDRRVIAMDHRGHGQSQKIHDPKLYSADIMAQDARRLLDYLNVDCSDIMGYSMGARVAAFLALAHPEKVRSVILGGLGFNIVCDMPNTSLIADALEASSVDLIKNNMARTFRVFAEQTCSDLVALAACIRSSRNSISKEDIALINCPVLVAVGTNDDIAGSARDLAKLIPNAQSFEIKGRDHMKAVGDFSYKQAVVNFLSERF
ncbi:MAG: alpha/beta hydrolase [Hyphomicrobiaceae bacterium]|nr:alpha/beta hydrolase [Hyphomicrobiaceae bacterium]